MSPLYSNPKNENASSLPIEATWKELSERTAEFDTTELVRWIDESLLDVEVQLRDFITPSSLKKSLRSGR